MEALLRRALRRALYGRMQRPMGQLEDESGFGRVRPRLRFGTTKPMPKVTCVFRRREGSIRNMRGRQLWLATWEFVSVSALSLVLGTGIGFLQGDLSTAGQLGDIRMVLPNEGGLTGALFSLPTGWIAYYLILRRKLSFNAFRTMMGILVLTAIAIGLVVGYLTKGDAAFASSIIMVPVTLIVVGLVTARGETGTA